jgi:hypothetical protein
MKKTMTMLIACMMVAGIVQAQSRQDLLERELAYLRGISEVRCVEFDNNSVYIHFKKLPSDHAAICSAAALKGNKKIDFGVHVWAILNATNPHGWRGGDPCEWWKCTTARHGKIER